MEVCTIVFVSSNAEGTKNVLVKGVYEDVLWWGYDEKFRDMVRTWAGWYVWRWFVRDKDKYRVKCEESVVDIGRLYVGVYIRSLYKGDCKWKMSVGWVKVAGNDKFNPKCM